MGSEAVVLQNAAPMGVNHLLALILRPHAVHPVILVRKTPARPAEHRYSDFLKGLHHVRPHTVYVGYAGILFYIKALIDASSQMFGKMSVNLRVDMPFFYLFINI